MTPKEKAIELVDKMYATQGPEDGITYYEAIDCALIAVDEILVVIKKNFINNVALHNGELSYWQEVKQEIEKL
jgi:hypothetical protein